MSRVYDYSRKQWEQYAIKLEEYASGNTVGDSGDLAYGTCRYCEYSELGLNLPAYEMFSVLEDITPIARALARHYMNARGRTEFRITHSAHLADFIRKEILK